MARELTAILADIKALANHYAADDFDVVRLDELADEAIAASQLKSIGVRWDHGQLVSGEVKSLDDRALERACEYLDGFPAGQTVFRGVSIDRLDKARLIKLVAYLAVQQSYKI